MAKGSRPSSLEPSPRTLVPPVAHGRRREFRLLLAIGAAIGMALALAVPAFGQLGGGSGTGSGFDLRLGGGFGAPRNAATFNVFFQGGSVRLDAAGQEVVALAADFVRTAGAKRVVVISNPSLQGGEIRDLASVRASAVVIELRRNRLPPGVTVVERGDTEGSYVPSREPGLTDLLDARVEIQVIP
jgi:hypothetical protein